MIDVKEAVKIAFQYIQDLFERESITNLGLEEVEFDGETNEWVVTVGFSRPWDYPQGALATALSESAWRPSRSYKVVRIGANSKAVSAIRNHDTVTT